MEKSVIDWIAMVLLIIGGLNWGLTGFEYNVVEMLLGAGIVANIIYWLVGLSALWAIYMLFKK